jgi:hypothetical protein
MSIFSIFLIQIIKPILVFKEGRKCPFDQEGHPNFVRKRVLQIALPKAGSGRYSFSMDRASKFSQKIRILPLFQDKFTKPALTAQYKHLLQYKYLL